MILDALELFVTGSAQSGSPESAIRGAPKMAASGEAGAVGRPYGGGVLRHAWLAAAALIVLGAGLSGRWDRGQNECRLCGELIEDTGGDRG